MCKDQRRGVYFYRFADNFSRMDFNMVQRVGKKTFMRYNSVLGVEKDYYKDFSFFIRELVL